MIATGSAPAAGEDALRAAATFYASFDEAVRGDFGDGDLALWTRSDHETDKGRHVFEKGFDASRVRIVPGRGVHGGALECTGPLARNGILFFPAGGKIVPRKGGWGGAVSFWVRPAPETPFCDLVYITQKRWNDGALWLDHNRTDKGDLRLGAFPSLAKGQEPPKETDPGIPMLRVEKETLKPGAWTHVALTWANAGSGRKDGRAALYLGGKLAAEIKDLDLILDWDVDQTRIYLAFQYQGLLDELALFNRLLAEGEVVLLRDRPGLLAPLKKAP